MQNSHFRTAYRRRKWPLPGPVRKTIALRCKIIALGCKVFYQSVKFLIRTAVQRRLATQTFTILTSSRIRYSVKLSYGAFSMSVNVERTRVSHAFVTKNMVQYMRPHGRFTDCECEPPVLACFIEIDYFFRNARETRVRSSFTDIENSP